MCQLVNCQTFLKITEQEPFNDYTYSACDNHLNNSTGMRMADARIAVVVVLLLVCRYSFAQDGCTPTPPSTLIGTAIGTNNKGVPFVAASENSKSST